MTASIKNQMGFHEWSMLIALAILWGGSFFIAAIVIKEIPPLTLVTLRVGLAAIVLWAAVLLSGQKIPTDPHIWLAFMIMGLLNNVIPFSLIFWGQKSIPGGLAAILNAATPLFTVFVASYFLIDEKITPLKLFGTLLGFIGVGIMIGRSALGGFNLNVLAQLAILGAAVSYAFAGTFGRRFRNMNVSSTTIAAAQVTCSTLIMIPFALLLEQPFSIAAPSTSAWIAIVILAVFCTAIAYLLYFRILSSAGATNLSLVTLLIPVTAALLGATFLGERLGLEHLFGMLLIALGLSAIDGRLWNRLRTRQI